MACFGKSDSAFPNNFSIWSRLKLQNSFLSTKYHFNGIFQRIYQLSVDDLAWKLSEVNAREIILYAANILNV